jgi:hypothetical protein
MPSPIQRFYERWEGTLQIATLILIPLVVFLYGNGISRSIEQAKTEQDYIRIATGILSQKVEKDQDQSAIRTWAADILMRYSPVPMNEEERRKLISGEARTFYGGYDDYPPDFQSSIPNDTPLRSLPKRPHPPPLK